MSNKAGAMPSNGSKPRSKTPAKPAPAEPKVKKDDVAPAKLKSAKKETKTAQAAKVVEAAAPVVVTLTPSHKLTVLRNRALVRISVTLRRHVPLG